MTDPITAHHHALALAFDRARRGEIAEQEATNELKTHEHRLKPRIAQAQKEQEEAWAEVRALMAETGETEVVLPYQGDIAARIHFTTPGVSTVVDAEACPDDLVTITRKPRLAEVKKRYFDDWQNGRLIPNWAQFIKGDPKLTWEPVTTPNTETQP